MRLDLRTRLGLRRYFKARHFRRREKFRQDYQQLAASLLEHLDFTSVLDVGCGNGFLLESFLQHGKQAWGIEVSADIREVLPPSLREHVEIADFQCITGQWDLVCCVEVAEHLPPRRSEELVEVLSKAARRWVFFTAAPLGQTGRGHINCRPHEEWLAWFDRRGWRRDGPRTAAVAAALSTAREAHWLAGNAIVLAPSRE